MSAGDAGRRRVAALALQHVGAVEPGGADADEHLARLGLGIRVLLDGDRLVADGDGSHGRDARPRSPVARTLFGASLCGHRARSGMC